MSICALMLLALMQMANAQIVDERGASFRMDHFDPLDYRGHPQNWSFAQSLDGKIYAANGTGILVYDGSDWSKVDTPGHDVARSLAVDGQGKVFVGTVGDFGYVDVDSLGNGIYRSLVSDSVAESFADVWRIYVRPESMVFMTSEAIFVLRDGRIQRIDAPSKFHTSFQIGSSIFVNDLGIGLHELRADSLQLAVNGEWFAGRKVYSFQSKDKNVVFNVKDDSFYSYNLSSGAIKSLVTPMDNYFARFPIYHAIQLHDGKTAYATMGGGTVVVSEDGILVDHLGRANGFFDDEVNHLFQDKEGSLWAALQSRGIIRVALPRRLTFFDSSMGLEGSVRDLVRFKGSLYAATGAGLYRLAENGRFEKVDGVPISWALMVLEDSLMVGTEAGLFRIDEGGVAQNVFPQDVFSLENTTRGIVLGTAAGIFVADSQHGSPTKLPSFDYDVRATFECDNSDIIAFTRSSGVKRIVMDSVIHVADIAFVPTEPKGRASLAIVNQAPAAQAQNGLYRLDRACSDRSAQLVFDDRLPISPQSVLLDAYEDAGGRLWTVTDNTVYVSTPGVDVPNLVPDLSFVKEHLSVIQVEDNRIVWMSVGEQLLRLDPEVSINTDASFAPVIGQVSNVGSGEVLANGRMSPISAVWGTPKLGYGDNDLRIEYSATIYANNDALAYSYYLDGRSANWSDWNTNSSSTFTNLREGEYTFRVKARNDFGNETPEASFSFVILPPWYRTTLAYIAYLLSIGIFGFLATKYYQLAVANKRAKEQALELAREKVVNEKLQEANQQLHVVNERLTEVNALKDEFLATTSHELRTPITAIQGYAAILKEELDGPHAEFAEIIDSSGQRLMRTLNAVLDLAKLRSGTVDLFPVDTNLKEFCLSVAEAYREKATAKGLVLHLDFSPDEIHIAIDQYSLKNIISNVLDNAVKFSDKGTITLSITKGNDEIVRIAVKDEGVGISHSFLPHVFDEFRQESESLSRERDGSGLGLSIASRMMDLVDGTINVQSQPDIGTTVTLSFKLGKSQLVTRREDDRLALPRASPDRIAQDLPESKTS